MAFQGQIRLNIINTDDSQKKVYPNYQGKRKFNAAIAALIEQNKVKVAEIPSRSAQSPKQLQITKGSQSLKIAVPSSSGTVVQRSNSFS